MKTMLIHKIQMGLSVCSRVPNKIKWASMCQLFSFTVFLLHVKKFSVTSRYFAFTDNFLCSQRSLLFCCIDIYVYFAITSCTYSSLEEIQTKEITSIICILYVYFFSTFPSFDYNMLHISSLSFLTWRLLAINLTPIKFFPKKIIDFSLLEKSIFKSLRYLKVWYVYQHVSIDICSVV